MSRVATSGLAGRHDFSLAPPSPNWLDHLRAAGVTVQAVGKISDIFAGAGIDHSTPTQSNGHGMSVTTRLLRESPDGTFIFTNLVETDMLWGHRNDPRGLRRRAGGHRRRAARPDGGICTTATC